MDVAFPSQAEFRRAMNVLVTCGTCPRAEGKHSSSTLKRGQWSSRIPQPHHTYHHPLKYATALTTRAHHYITAADIPHIRHFACRRIQKFMGNRWTTTVSHLLSKRLLLKGLRFGSRKLSYTKTKNLYTQTTPTEPITVSSVVNVPRHLARSMVAITWQNVSPTVIRPHSICWRA
jgi:hypothetical protein